MLDIAKNPRLDVFNEKIVHNARFSHPCGFPLLERTDYVPEKALPFNAAKRSRRYKNWVHFYIYDYHFERIWHRPERYLPILKKFAGVITPDYSLFRNMPLVMQMWNTYRNRAIGCWLQGNGIKTVTNVRWGDERTYAFAFEGLKKGGTYAVCTNGCIKGEMDRHYFKKGLEKMVEKLKPDTIINYSYYSDDIFDRYKKKGIEIKILEHWSDRAEKRYGAED